MIYCLVCTRLLWIVRLPESGVWAFNPMSRWEQFLLRTWFVNYIFNNIFPQNTNNNDSDEKFISLNLPHDFLSPGGKFQRIHQKIGRNSKQVWRKRGGVGCRGILGSSPSHSMFVREFVLCFPLGFVNCKFSHWNKSLLVCSLPAYVWIHTSTSYFLHELCFFDHL